MCDRKCLNLRKVEDSTLLDKVHNSDIQKLFNIELSLLRIENFLLRLVMQEL